MRDDKKTKRRFSRVPFKCDAMITDPRQHVTWTTALIDICLNGALVKRPESWNGKEGDVYELQIKLDGSNAAINMEVVHVAHIHEDCVGFTCEDIDIDSITHLRRLVELNLGDAELIHRELDALGQSHGT